MTIGHHHQVFQGSSGVCLHVTLHNLKTDEDTYPAGGIVTEITGERGLVNHATDDIIGVVIDQVLLHEVVPDRRLVGGRPLVLLFRVTKNVLRLQCWKHSLREQHLFPSIHHVVQESYQRFIWQMLVNQRFCKTVRGHVFRLATGRDVFRHSCLSVLLVILAHIHVQTDENGVLVAENGGHLEINAGHQCAEIGGLIIREMRKVKRQRRNDLFLEIRQIRIFCLRIIVDFLDYRVADKTFDGLQILSSNTASSNSPASMALTTSSGRSGLPGISNWL